MSSSRSNERILYRAFRDTQSYLDDLFIVYNDVYPSIPRIYYEETLSDKYSFAYCRARRYFVVVLPYTKHYEILLERSFAQDKLSWAIIGGSLRVDLMETFIDAANRHAAKTVGNLELGELEPIAFMENCFIFNGEKHYHRGIAFAARIRNVDPIHDLRAAMYSRIGSRGFLVPCNDRSVKLNLSNSESVVDVLRNYLSNFDVTDAPEFEVSENLKYHNRYVIHNRITKPLFKMLGRYHFEHSIQDLDNKIIEIVLDGVHERILDLACGENLMVMRCAKLSSANLIIGNDVSWSQIQLMEAQATAGGFRNTSSFVLFTNHDARRLPFMKSFFDVSVCKNALHHMDDLHSAANLIRNLVRVSKRALIVEIMDPMYENIWGKLRHRYYLDFLHDAGSNFLSRTEFETITDIPERVSTFEMRTIRGVYMFALFSQESENPTT